MTEIERQMLHARRRWAKIQRNPPEWSHEFGDFGLTMLLIDEAIKAIGWKVIQGLYTDGRGRNRQWPNQDAPYRVWWLANYKASCGGYCV